MRTIALVFESSRDAHKLHRTVVTMGGKALTGPIHCTCPAGRRGGKCKHIRLLSLLADQGTEEEILKRWGNQPGW